MVRWRALVLAATVAFSGFGVQPGTSDATGGGQDTVRYMERLNRAPVAVMTGEGVFIGWRLLGTDAPDIAFNLYRNGVKINATPINGATNWLDPAGELDDIYEIRPVVAGSERPDEAETARVWVTNYLDVPIQKPPGGVTPLGEAYTYSANDASVGDLDGDGDYEIVLKWDPSNSKDNSQAGYTGPVYLDAYKLDGTRLWRINFGPNIRAGAHYTQFLVYDFDGDGRAEVVAKTADGTIDGRGTVIGDPNADYRNQNGYILQGPEYLTVFDGLTGRAMVTVPYDPPRGNVGDWGDTYGNRVDRFLAAVAYLDGERPSIVMARGYYTRTVLVAYNWRDGQLTKLWTFDTTHDPNNPLYAYAGQGNHNLSVADVDGDGRDEIIYGGMTVDDNGQGLYTTGVGHGDALHVSDFDPARPGLEVFKVSEPYPNPAGIAMWDAATGQMIWNVATNYDVGRGAAADIDPRYPGAEAWAIGEPVWNTETGGIYTTTGQKISNRIPPANFVIWWDGDLLREILDHYYDASRGVGVGRIAKWDYENQQTVDLLVATGTFSNNGTKGNPVLQADLFGDWREEVIWRLEDSSALRIYTTTDVTNYRIYTLMHDPVYRLGIAWQNVGYNQPPHTSFYLGVGMNEPPAPRIMTGPISRGTTGFVSGWVENRSGKPLSGATVTLEAGETIYSTTTNAHGYYSFSNVPMSGNVTLNASSAGCEPETVTIDVTAGYVQRDLNLYCPATGITLNLTSATVFVGQTLQLQATITPSFATNQTVTWVSSNPEVAIVDENGLVTGLSVGTATITAVSNDNPALNATSQITVNAVSVEGLTLSKSVLNVLVGMSKQIVAFVEPPNATNPRVIWTSSDPSIATVDGNGRVTGVSPGTVTITATTEDGGFTRTCVVNVQSAPVAATGVTVNPDAYYFASDHFSETNPAPEAPRVRLEATVLPLEATENNVVWSSSNPSVAVVDEFGNVTARGSGVAEIVAATVDGGFAATARVYVPVISESFDNRMIGDAWGAKTGTAGGSGNLGGAVAQLPDGNRVFRLQGGGSGVRSTQKVFTRPIVNRKVMLDFDWNVGTPSGSPGAQLSIEDSAGRRYLTLQYRSGQEMIYGTGGTASNAVITGNPVGTGFNVNDALYHIRVTLDFVSRTISLTVTNKDNPSVTSEIRNIPFDPNTVYTNDVGKIQFVLVRQSGQNTSWTTWLDNFNVYALTPDLVPLGSIGIRDSAGTPVDGTTLRLRPGDTKQLVAVLDPANADVRSVRWSSDNPEVATVDPSSGFVTAVSAGNAVITLTVDAFPDLGGTVLTKAMEIQVGEWPPEGAWARSAVSGPGTVVVGRPLDLTVGVTGVTYGFTALDVIVRYDPAKLEFDTVTDDTYGYLKLAPNAIESLRENFTVLDTAVRPQDGQIRIIMASSGEANAVTTDGNLFVLRGRVKADATPGSTTVRLSDFQASRNGEPGTVEVSQASLTLDIHLADKTALNAVIAEAQTLYDTSPEGTQPGQYPPAAKAMLRSAIDAAIAVRDNPASTQAQVDTAVAMLQNAMTTFRNSVILPPPPPPPADVDKSALQQAITAAQGRYEKAVEGTKVGQYRSGAKAALQAAIQAAIAVRDNAWATQADVDAAVAALNEAVRQFQTQVVTLAEGATQVSIRDLAIVAKFYGATSADPNWSQIAKADLFDEGRITLRVLAAIARMILAEWATQ